MKRGQIRVRKEGRDGEKLDEENSARTESERPSDGEDGVPDDVPEKGRKEESERQYRESRRSRDSREG